MNQDRNFFYRKTNNNGHHRSKENKRDLSFFRKRETVGAEKQTVQVKVD